MKKLLSFLWIFLLGSIQLAHAAVQVGEPIDPAQLNAGDRILIRSGNAVNSIEPLIFKWASALPDSSLWLRSDMYGSSLDQSTVFILEAADEMLEGRPTFYLKNEKYGLYYTYSSDDLSLGDRFNSGIMEAEVKISFTMNRNEAIPFAFFKATEGILIEHDGGSYTGDPQPDNTHIMIATRVKEHTSGKLYAFVNQAWEQPYLASYMDWGGWQNVYYADVTEDYYADLQVLYNKVKDLSYMGGTNPGQYDKALVAAFYEALTNAQAIITNGASQEECKVAYEALDAAWQAIQTAKPFPVTPGYYKMINATSTEAITRFLSAKEGAVRWFNWDYMLEPNHVWEVIDRKDGTFLMRNVGTNEYISDESNSYGVTGSKIITTAKDSTNNPVTFIPKTNGYFNIKQRTNNSLHAEAVNNYAIGSSGYVVSWNYSDDSFGPSQWAFEAIPSDSIAYYEAIGQQRQRDRALTELLTIAQNKYALGNAFNIDYDTPLLTAKEQILSNAAHMSTDPYTNEHGVWGTSQDGGGYPALIDNDPFSFFHSAWGGFIREWHYLDFDLGQELNAVALSYSARLNYNNIFPTAYNIYAAKADADTSKIGSWQLIRTFSNQPADLDTVFHPGIELEDAYRYLRFEVTATKNNAKLNGYPFFALSAMQIYPATRKETCFNAVNPVAMELKNMIKAALTVRPGETTQEDIDQLQLALNNYLAEFADPSALKQTIDSVRTNILERMIAVDKESEINGLKIYPDPGTYTNESKQTIETYLSNIEKYLAEGAEQGIYDKDYLNMLHYELQRIVREECQARPFRYADSETQGNWYQIAASNRYYYANPDVPQYGMRKGVIYIQAPEGQQENATLSWATADSLQKANIPAAYAQWRFVAVTDSTYAIQNRATGLYITQRSTHPATVSASPVAFKIDELGYGAFTFKGYHLDGEPVANNYLHAQPNQNMVVYWNHNAIDSGSAWEIWNTEDFRTEEAGEPVINFNQEIKVEKFTRLELGKLQAMCYPIDLRLVDDRTGNTSPVYTIAAADEEKVTLAPATEVKAGTPFFYLAGNTLRSAIDKSDSVQVSAYIAPSTAIACRAQRANGLVGCYKNQVIPYGAYTLKDMTWNSGMLQYRLQVLSKEAFSVDFNSAYVLVDSIKNMTEIPSGAISIYFEHAVDTTMFDTAFSERQALQATFERAAAYKQHIGTSTGQYSGPDFLEAYNHAYDMLTASEDSAELSQADIRLQAAIDALQLNLPEAGKYYRFRSYATGAYLYSDKDSDPLRLSTYVNPANIKPTTFFLSDEGRLTGSLMLNLADSIFDHTGLGNSYMFTESGTERTYFIRNEQGKFLCNADSTLSITNDSSDITALWYIEEMTDSTQYPGRVFAPVNYKDKCYYTLYAPVGLYIKEFDYTNTVYTVQIQDDRALLSPIADGIVPAGTAVVVEFDTPYTLYPFINNIFYTTGGNRELTSDLQGSFVETPVEEGMNYYTLQLINGQLGFFRYGGQTLSPYRAYLKLPASQQIKGFLISDGQTTGIDVPAAGDSKAPVIYDLSGRRLERIVQPGIYIINGEKVIVK